MVTYRIALALAVLLSITASADQGARPPLTPEQAAEQKRRAADTAIADGVRPIDMLDSVWMEELSWMEVRDQMAAGKTTALLGSGGVEKNGPYTATGKHNYVLKTTLEATARKHTKALVAPLVTWEPCNPDRANLTPGAFCVTPDTYKGAAPRCGDQPQEHGLQGHLHGGRQRRQHAGDDRDRQGAQQQVDGPAGARSTTFPSITTRIAGATTS